MMRHPTVCTIATAVIAIATASLIWAAAGRTTAADAQEAAPDAAQAPQEQAPPEPKPEEAKIDARTWHEVKAGPFEVVLSLSGNFEAASMSPIKPDPLEWSALEVVEAVSHGQSVRAGDVLIRFDTEDLEQAITDLEAALPAQRLALTLARDEAERAAQTLDNDIADAQRAHQRATENLDRYLQIDRDIEVRNAGQIRTNADNELAYQTEELEQLERMYAADDLTEETEQIILKRQRDTVARAVWAQERAHARSDEIVEVTMPRQDIDSRRAVERSLVNMETAQTQLPVKLEQKQAAVVKAENDLAKSVERLGKLREDLAAMVVRSPADGVVYYGEWKRGAWNGAAAAEDQLIPGGTVRPKQVVMTVVSEDELHLLATVAEAMLYRARPGLSGIATPSGWPDAAMAATLRSVDGRGLGGRHEVAVDVDLPAGTPIRPGMSGNARFKVYEAEQAVTLPRQVLRQDEPGRWWVWVRQDDGGSVKRDVRVGWFGDGEVEILDGVEPGEHVRLRDPDGEDESKAPAAPVQQQAQQAGSDDN